MLGLLRNSNILRVINATAAGTTTISSSGVDMSDAETVTFYLALGTLTATAVPTVKVQQSDDDGASDAYDDLGGSLQTFDDQQGNKIVAVEVIRPLKRYVRIQVGRGTANAVLDGAVAVKSHIRKTPVAQHSTVAGTPKTLIGPAEGTA